MSNNEKTRTFTVGATTLVDMEGYAVKVASGLAEKSAASTLMIGVVRKGAAAGKLCDIAMVGDIAPVILEGTVTEGARLKVTATSGFTASTPSDNDVMAAIALEDGDSGDLIDALICTPFEFQS